MRSVISVFLLALLSLAGTPAAARDTAPAPAQSTAKTASPDEQASLRARLVGTWEEFSPGSNFIDIRADGVFAIHLKKGEIAGMKEVDGTWTLDGRTFRATVTVNGTSTVRVATVTFDGDEMLLTDPESEVTRHRRHDGELPAEFRW